MLTLDLPSSLVLVADDFFVYATAQREDLANCISSYSNLHHCSASQFAYILIADHACQVALTHATATYALASCPYKHVVPNNMHHKTFHGFHYFFFSQPSISRRHLSGLHDVSAGLRSFCRRGLLSSKIRESNYFSFSSTFSVHGQRND